MDIDLEGLSEDDMKAWTPATKSGSRAAVRDGLGVDVIQPGSPNTKPRAESQMIIIEKTLERAFPKDELARHGIMEAARERIAQHLGRGHSFGRATINEPMRDRHRSEGDKGDALQTRNAERVRIQERER